MKFLPILALAIALHPFMQSPKIAQNHTFRIPAASAAYKARVIREAHAKGGLGAPVPMFAGQLTQESGFNPEAHSGVGAQGLAQFMPPTAQWLAKVSPKDFSPANSLDPDWSIRALIFYDYWLADRLPMYSEADNNRWGAALAGYNGGLGWVQKDSKIGACNLWWGCGNMIDDGRTAANLQQNRDYPERIIHGYAPLYVQAGWK